MLDPPIVDVVPTEGGKKGGPHKKSSPTARPKEDDSARAVFDLL